MEPSEETRTTVTTAISPATDASTQSGSSTATPGAEAADVQALEVGWMSERSIVARRHNGTMV
jgi:hypothetical protein